MTRDINDYLSWIMMSESHKQIFKYIDKATADVCDFISKRSEGRKYASYGRFCKRLIYRQLRICLNEGASLGRSDSLFQSLKRHFRVVRTSS